jgi:hypothetical protein
MVPHVLAHCTLSIFLVVGTTLMSMPSLGALSADDATANQSVTSGTTSAPPGAPDGDHSKPAGKPNDVKDTKLPASASGKPKLSNRELARKRMERCRTHPESCVQRRDKSKGEPPSESTLDK